MEMQFYQLLIPIFGCFLLTTILVPLSMKVGILVGAVDHPGVLKIHSKPVPRFGGMALFLSSAAIFYFLSPSSLMLNRQAAILISFSTLLIFLCGVLDDVKNLQPLTKLLFQITAVIMAVTGLFASSNSWHTMNGIFAFIFMLGYTNAFNLIDGVDGLAAGSAVFIASGLLAISLLLNHVFTIWITSIVIGAASGFLIFNFNPAKIFLGDSGSTLLGFVLALSATTIWLDSKNPLVILPLLIVLGMPVFDTIFAVLRRLKKRKSIFIGDRSHLYDQLMRKGFSVRQTVLIFYAIGMLLSVVGVSLFILIEF